MRRGLYRVHGIAGAPDGVRCDDDGIEVPVEENSYRVHDYRPRLEDLPWQEAYLHTKDFPDETSDAAELAAKAARAEERQAFLARFRKT